MAQRASSVDYNFAMIRLRCVVRQMVLAVMLLAALAAHSSQVVSRVVDIERLTWVELQARLDAGSTTVLIPIGGTEQSGPHIALGKHNVRAHALADEIARQLGNAVVAPVIAYVPEGNITPPTAHMRFVGTISIPVATFESMLEATARSFKQHGFKDIFFLGDHGGYQNSEQRVADRLNREWRKDPACRVHALRVYYETTQTTFVNALKKQGFTSAEIGTHAGLNDTALTLAVDPGLVRSDVVAHGADLDAAHGVYGDPRRATAEIGRVGTQAVVTESVQAIRRATAARR